MDNHEKHISLHSQLSFGNSASVSYVVSHVNTHTKTITYSQATNIYYIKLNKKKGIIRFFKKRPYVARKMKTKSWLLCIDYLIQK